MSPELQENKTLEESDSEHSLEETWSLLSAEEQLVRFSSLDRDEAEEFFHSLNGREHAQLILLLPSAERRHWVRLLAPDDAADLLQEIPAEERENIEQLLDKVTRREVSALLAYAEDEAGGLMSPRYARLRPDMTVDEAITYLRRQARRPIETLSYFYVLDQDQFLMGVVSFRDLFLQPGQKLISEIMQTDVVTVDENTNQEEISRLLQQHNLVAVPVIDESGVLKGIVTIDDIVDAIQEEATEDIQKIGGSEALDAPYLQVSIVQMLKKRAGWLSILFIGEMFTATAMAHYENEIARAVVLALFIPLIISSGGNAGSQASTLVVRALALGEIRSRHWWRILYREVGVGISIGLLLGGLGFLRVVCWPNSVSVYGEHYMRLGVAVAGSLIGVVTWGTMAGAMLPLILRRLGLDPASASAPFVATIVDVTGLVIYFTLASVILNGVLL